MTRHRDSSCRIGRFRRDDSGAMVLLGLVFLLLMLMMGGLAVDLMRFEAIRTQLQQTTDRAVLAAASLKQKLDPEDVVRDYFDKAGLSHQLKSVEVVQSFNAKSVSVTAAADVPPFFLHLIGIDELSAPAAGTATEKISNIEISLVIDISGSMRDNNKIGNLRLAAKDFVSTVLAGDGGVSTSINLVPYAGQTNPGPQLFDLLGGTRTHASSSCLELAAADFGTTTVPTGPRAQVPHFMFWPIAAAVMDWGWCPADNNAVRVAQGDAAALRTVIDTIRMHDGTGTQNAMKWGVALLDPSARPVFSQMTAANGAPAGFAVADRFSDRPLDFGAPDSMKVVVLMTDGQITEQYRPVDPAAAVNATVELQTQGAAKYVQSTSRATNVSAFYQVCNLAKARQITVFTIAFEAPSTAKTEMRTCATSVGHFYDVSGLQIQSAFRSIANQIANLRLTQ
jgi:Flp pilus assembly protein TadG